MDIRDWLLIILYYLLGMLWMSYWIPKMARRNQHIKPNNTSEAVGSIVGLFIIISIWPPLLLQDLYVAGKTLLARLSR